MPAYSQGSTVSFDGGDLGQLTGWSLEGGKAVTVDITTIESSIYGASDNTRIRRELDATGIEPGKLSVRLLGCPPYAVADIGKKGGLSVTFTGGSLSGEAILDDFRVEGAVGELLVGSATFILTGA